METRWTKGPWEVTECDSVVDSTNTLIQVSGFSVPCGYTPRDHVSYVNSRLIATAPDMYELLDSFIRWSAPLAEYAGSQWADDNDLSQECHWLNETSKEAITVLTKARGESPKGGE